MDRTQFKATITDDDAVPEMTDEETELLSYDLDEMESLSEFKAYMARIGVVIEPENPRELTSDAPGMYDTIH
jgi:uncharacterized protein with von Willebrand factor type A (vWA) domain